MFERFLQVYWPIEGEEPQPDVRLPWPHGEVRGFHEMMSAFPGRGFEDGLYRLHSEASGRAADALLAEGVPWVAEQCYAFGHAWNGIQFALDRDRRDSDREPFVLMIDSWDWTVFEIDATFGRFHTEELIERTDSAVDSDLFEAWAWANQHALPLRHGQIVGLKIPLTLGGKDVVENMMVIDFDVEASLNAQIRGQIADLPDGTPVRGVKVG